MSSAIPPERGPVAGRPTGRSYPIWRSGLFWRIMWGALVAFLTMLLTIGLALALSNRLVNQGIEGHDAAQNVARINYFANNIESTYQALSLLGTSGYNPRFYDIEQSNLSFTRNDLSNHLDDSTLAAYRGRLKAILDSFDQINPQLARLNDQARTDRLAALRIWDDTYERDFDSLRKDAHTLAENIDSTSSQSVKDAADFQNLTQITVPLIGLAGLLIGIVLMTIVVRGTVQRITGISGDIQRLAEGDLTPPARLGRGVVASGALPDELAGLERAYLKTIERLRTPLHRIQADAARISASSSEISNAATYQAVGSNEQATAITQVTVTVEELNQTAVQIADAAASVAAAAEQALVSASRGQEAVRDSIIGMAMIRSRVNDITSRILALSAQSQRISEIIDVIDEMAARTHILALNAAVESASAGGEAGERFGVVASEVKKLAQRSAGATREVRTVIAQVQAATNAAVMATEDGLKETEKGVQLAHQSGDANEDIIQMVERTAQLANAISLATQQQRTASEQVVATMREVAQVTRQAASSSTQASRAANELSDIAQELRTVSESFHTGGDAEVPPPDSGATPRQTTRLLTGESTT